jgi:glycogen debranching enzyme
MVIFCLLPLCVKAENASFLKPFVTRVEKSIVCPQGNESECKSVFLISGKNFLNSNGEPAVRVGNEWAEVARASDKLVVAMASEDAINNTPSIAVDTTLHRPKLVSDDSVLVEIFDDSVDVAIASIGMTKQGVRYISAGPRYMDPPRVYYRDTYWSSGMILMIEPYVVRDQILLLARGIEGNGSVPSAIPVEKGGRKISLWTDHYDSGAYFIMLVYDYIRWTGDETILIEKVDGRTIYNAMEDIVSHLSSKDTDLNNLPEKPLDSKQDWLDSIPRSGEVISNAVLYYKALRDLSEMAETRGEKIHALAFHRKALLVRHQINEQFWNKKGKYLFESCYQGKCVERVTAESALAVLYGVLDSERSVQQLDALQRLEKEWGVINAWPLYNGFARYHYQNGTDWPFLDGINAGARLRVGDAGWYFPLTRWWEYNNELKTGKVLPEYVSYLDKHAGDKQAWSVNPIVSYVRYGLGIDPGFEKEVVLTSDKDADATLKEIVLRGKRVNVSAKPPVKE